MVLHIIFFWGGNPINPWEMNCRTMLQMQPSFGLTQMKPFFMFFCPFWIPALAPGTRQLLHETIQLEERSDTGYFSHLQPLRPQHLWYSSDTAYTEVRVPRDFNSKSRCHRNKCQHEPSRNDNGADSAFVMLSPQIRQIGGETENRKSHCHRSFALISWRRNFQCKERFDVNTQLVPVEFLPCTHTATGLFPKALPSFLHLLYFMGCVLYSFTSIFYDDLHGKGKGLGTTVAIAFSSRFMSHLLVASCFWLNATSHIRWLQQTSWPMIQERIWTKSL